MDSNSWWKPLSEDITKEGGLLDTAIAEMERSGLPSEIRITDNNGEVIKSKTFEDFQSLKDFFVSKYNEGEKAFEDGNVGEWQHGTDTEFGFEDVFNTLSQGSESFSDALPKSIIKDVPDTPFAERFYDMLSKYSESKDNDKATIDTPVIEGMSQEEKVAFIERYCEMMGIKAEDIDISQLRALNQSEEFTDTDLKLVAIYNENIQELNDLIDGSSTIHNVLTDALTNEQREAILEAAQSRQNTTEQVSERQESKAETGQQPEQSTTKEQRSEYRTELEYKYGVRGKIEDNIMVSNIDRLYEKFTSRFYKEGNLQKDIENHYGKAEYAARVDAWRDAASNILKDRSLSIDEKYDKLVETYRETFTERDSPLSENRDLFRGVWNRMETLSSNPTKEGLQELKEYFTRPDVTKAFTQALEEKNKPKDAEKKVNEFLDNIDKAIGADVSDIREVASQVINEYNALTKGTDGDVDNRPMQDVDSDKAIYLERAEEWSNKQKDGNFSSYRKDTFAAFAKWRETVNKFKAASGEDRVNMVGDLVGSFVNFTQSNIYETLVIYLIKGIVGLVEKIGDKPEKMQDCVDIIKNVSNAIGDKGGVDTGATAEEAVKIIEVSPEIEAIDNRLDEIDKELDKIVADDFDKRESLFTEKDAVLDEKIETINNTLSEGKVDADTADAMAKAKDGAVIEKAKVSLEITENRLAQAKVEREETRTEIKGLSKEIGALKQSISIDSKGFGNEVGQLASKLRAHGFDTGKDWKLLDVSGRLGRIADFIQKNPKLISNEYKDIMERAGYRINKEGGIEGVKENSLVAKEMERASAREKEADADKTVDRLSGEAVEQRNRIENMETAVSNGEHLPDSAQDQREAQTEKFEQPSATGDQQGAQVANEQQPQDVQESAATVPEKEIGAQQKAATEQNLKEELTSELKETFSDYAKRVEVSAEAGADKPDLNGVEKAVAEKLSDPKFDKLSEQEKQDCIKEAVQGVSETSKDAYETLANRYDVEEPLNNSPVTVEQYQEKVIENGEQPNPQTVTTEENQKFKIGVGQGHDSGVTSEAEAIAMDNSGEKGPTKPEHSSVDASKATENIEEKTKEFLDDRTGDVRESILDSKEIANEIADAFNHGIDTEAMAKSVDGAIESFSQEHPDISPDEIKNFGNELKAAINDICVDIGVTKPFDVDFFTATPDVVSFDFDINENFLYITIDLNDTPIDVDLNGVTVQLNPLEPDANKEAIENVMRDVMKASEGDIKEAIIDINYHNDIEKQPDDVGSKFEIEPVKTDTIDLVQDPPDQIDIPDGNTGIEEGLSEGAVESEVGEEAAAAFI